MLSSLHSSYAWNFPFMFVTLLCLRDDRRCIKCLLLRNVSYFIFMLYFSHLSCKIFNMNKEVSDLWSFLGSSAYSHAKLRFWQVRIVVFRFTGGER